MELRHLGVAVSYIEPGALDTGFFTRSASVRASRGYAGDPATAAVYAEAIRRVGDTLSAAKPAALAPTLQAIEHALTARTPAPRNLVGREATTITGVVRRLPTAARHRAVLRACTWTPPHSPPARPRPEPPGSALLSRTAIPPRRVMP
jgi:hypothetical protein